MAFDKEGKMTQSEIKQRHKRAVNRAISILEKPPTSYQIIPLNHHTFHIEAVREREIRSIRIVLDQILPEDEKLVRGFKFPPVVTKEIWCKKLGSQQFDTKEIS